MWSKSEIFLVFALPGGARTSGWRAPCPRMSSLVPPGPRGRFPEVTHGQQPGFHADTQHSTIAGCTKSANRKDSESTPSSLPRDLWQHKCCIFDPHQGFLRYTSAPAAPSAQVARGRSSGMPFVENVIMRPAWWPTGGGSATPQNLQNAAWRLFFRAEWAPARPRRSKA